MRNVTITSTRKWRALTLSEKLASLTLKSDACWVWNGTIQQHGYGTLTHEGKRIYAHRASYEVANGPIPTGRRIDHICHNESCIKPDHLRVATVKQNAENFGGLMTSNNSGYRGVYRHTQTGRWSVQVTHNGRRYSGGLHADIEDANAAAIALRTKLHTHNDLDRVA